MRLKSPTEKPVHIALLSGHAITIGPEARDVPVMFRRDALAKGCLPEGVSAAELNAVEQAPTEKDKPALLDAAIKTMLEGNNQDDFTGAGLPNRKKISAIVGWNVTAEDLTAAWQKVEAEAAE